MNSLIPSLHKLEEIQWKSLLGVRFWDPVNGHHVRDDLYVIIWPKNNPELTRRASRTASGNYLFQRLLGLRSSEIILNSDQYNKADQQEYMVRVLDLRGRFLPLVFKVKVPRENSCLFPNGIDPPDAQGEPWPGVPLFSSPARNVSPGTAVIRAQLVDRAPDPPAPAKFALICVEINGSKWYGLTNGQGCAAVHFPYPDLQNMLTGVAQDEGDQPIGDTTWDLRVSVNYKPGKESHKPGGRRYIQDQAFPVFLEILNQPEAKLVLKENDDPAEEGTYQLVYGQELVLRTDGETKDIPSLFIESQ